VVARRSLFCALAAPLIGLAINGAPASAATCGVADAQPSRATLTLNDQSVTSVAYGRTKAPVHTLLLRFKAAGCVVPDDVAQVTTEVVPKQGMSELPDGAVTLLRARVDGDEFSVRLAIAPSRFPPGSYGGFVEVRSPFVLTARTPIAVSRSESNLLWPLLIGTLGGLVGLGWFWFLSRAKGWTTSVRGPQYAVVFAAAAAAGIVAVVSSYLDQEVWTVGANGFAAMIAAFTGATTGAMATALTVLWRQPDDAGKAIDTTGDRGTDPVAA
jgi:hypothetical protein